MSFPSDRRYTETHEWFRVDGDTVTVGITRFAADELADITYVDLPSVGTNITAGSAFGEIESVKATAELFAAVGGQVIEINEALAEAPELVNDEPFEDGWMVKIKTQDLGPLEKLMNAGAYESHCAAQDD